MTVEILDVKYPQGDDDHVIWDSSCHNAYAEDSLNATHINAKPGGKQQLCVTLCAR